MLSNWGEFVLCPELFAEELVYLATNLSVVIKLGDPELCGEFLHCLRILGVPESSFLLQRGIKYLLGRERTLKCKGQWIKSTRDYFKVYHAGYCALIGLLEFQIKPQTELLEQWKKYFL